MLQKNLIKELEDIVKTLDEADYADNDYDCYGCCGCCRAYSDLTESIQVRLNDIIKKIKD